jgi:hypothetical protein
MCLQSSDSWPNDFGGDVSLGSLLFLLEEMDMYFLLVIRTFPLEHEFPLEDEMANEKAAILYHSSQELLRAANFDWADIDEDHVGMQEHVFLSQAQAILT